ncbi:MAG: hypothetical protein IPJ69_06715 [Deltaproteobacteria bacterium]|nr:MAG: hypothetical protein IPJ69_06715 [Deltaproteobacteria bacterium]
MTESDALQLISDTRSLVFSTRELAALANIRIDFASQMLRRMAAKKKITRLYQGLWAYTQNPEFNAFVVVPYLTRPHPAAISLFTALHLHGMIEQVPQVIHIVSTSMTRKIKTPIGSFSIHKIQPEFFQGYDNGYGNLAGQSHFLVATPEKAFVDCLYFSMRKGKYFGSFPELTFPKTLVVKSISVGRKYFLR